MVYTEVVLAHSLCIAAHAIMGYKTPVKADIERAGVSFDAFVTH
jgi:hypothetical protein